MCRDCYHDARYTRQAHLAGRRKSSAFDEIGELVTNPPCYCGDGLSKHDEGGCTDWPAEGRSGTVCDCLHRNENSPLDRA
jgi:hypothetical protein